MVEATSRSVSWVTVNCTRKVCGQLRENARRRRPGPKLQIPSSKNQINPKLQLPIFGAIDSTRGGGHLQDGFHHALHAKARHATEINGAGAAETRRASDIGEQEAVAGVAGQTWAGHFRRSAPKRDDNRRTESGGDVHRPGVVGEQDPAKLEECHQFPQPRFPREIDHAATSQLGDGVAELRIVWTAKRQPDTAVRPARNRSEEHTSELT